MTKDRILLSAYLTEDERPLVFKRMGELGRGMSLNKIARALILLWAEGEIALNRDEVLEITPDTRYTRDTHK